MKFCWHKWSGWELKATITRYEDNGVIHPMPDPYQIQEKMCLRCGTIRLRRIKLTPAQGA